MSDFTRQKGLRISGSGKTSTGSKEQLTAEEQAARSKAVMEAIRSAEWKHDAFKQAKAWGFMSEQEYQQIIEIRIEEI